jgi:hypothetical protein
MTRATVNRSASLPAEGRARVAAWMREQGVEMDAPIWNFPLGNADFRPNRIVWARFLRGFPADSASSALAAEVLRWAGACWLSGCGGEFPRTRFSAARDRLRLVRRILLRLVPEHQNLETITPRAVQAEVQQMYLNEDGSSWATTQTLRTCLDAIHDLYRLRRFLPSGFSVDPFPPIYIASVVSRGRRAVPWNAPPEPVCLELIRQAIRLTGAPAQDLTRLRDKYIQACERAKRMRCGEEKIVRLATASLKGERFSIVPGEHHPWTDLDPEDPRVICKLILVLEGACATTLLFLSGPRISEVLRAGTGSLQYVRHSNGIRYPYFFAERSKQGAPDRAPMAGGGHRLNLPGRGWILGAAGVQALSVLHKLSRWPRMISGINNYWLTVRGAWLWNSAHNKTPMISVTIPDALNGRLNAFADHVQLTQRTGWSGRLHSHMGRKACARFIAKRDRTALADLAVQFGHLNAYVTDSCYAQPDSEYRRLLEVELASEMADVAQDLAALDVKRTFAPMRADELGEIQKRMTRFVGDLRSGLEVRQMLGAGVRLVPCDWGMCVYRPQTSACRGGQHGPSERRSPAVCQKCVNFVATTKHRPFWQRRVKDCRRTLAHRGLPEQTVQLVKLRLAEALEVLTSIAKDERF